MRLVPQERSGEKTAMWLARGIGFGHNTGDLGPPKNVLDDLPDLVRFSGE